MNSPDAASRRAAWSAYWAGGSLHSCVGSFAGNYDGAIGDFWRGVFARLPGGQLRMLDLATGNGAIPQLAWQAPGLRGRLRIDAVDLAEPAPTWLEAGDATAIEFHAGVAMEALPFPDATFDLASSQYGFEYADRQPALEEVLRVLKPGGRLALVMHHAGSVLVQVARVEVRHQARLLAPGGLLAAAEGVLPWLALARRGGDPGQHPEALAAREGYNQAVGDIAAAIDAGDSPDVLAEVQARVHQLLAGVGSDAAPALAALAGLRADLEAASLRTRELVDCALSQADVDALLAMIRERRPDLVTGCTELRQAEGLLGWGLEGRPA